MLPYPLKISDYSIHSNVLDIKQTNKQTNKQISFQGNFLNKQL